MDFRLSFMWQFLVNMLTNILTTFGIIAYNAPWFLLAVLPISALCTCHSHLLAPCRVRHSVAIYDQLLLYCDQSMREKDWRSRKRGA